MPTLRIPDGVASWPHRGGRCVPGWWLVAGVVCLVALVCLAIGVVTQLALQHSLIGRLDAQHTAAGRRCS